MKITKVDFVPIRIKLKEPYTIAYETVSEVTNIFIRLATDSNIIAYGCSAPDFAVTGETPDQAIEDTSNIIKPFLLGKDPLTYSRLLIELKSVLTNKPATLALVDSALFDCLGKIARLPIYKIFGAHKEKILTSVTIGILPLDDTLLTAKDFIQKGFKVLKLKGGLDVDEDIQKILKLRELVGKDIEIRFDANQGYTLDDTFRFCENIKEAEIEILEQPTPKSKPELLGECTNALDVLVMADECILNLKDVFRIVKNDLVDTINIKLMKVGGIQEALHVNSVAKAANVSAMVGCMDESALSIAAGLHFSLSRSNIEYADLDGHFDLVDDPCEGAVILEDGYLLPTGKPGLGFNMNDEYFY